MAVPLLALFIPLQVAVPLAVLLSITVAALIILQDWRKIYLRSISWLLVSSVFGIPLGLLLLKSGHQRTLKAALAIIIISYSAYAFLDRTPPELRSDSRKWLVFCGFCAGVLGGAFGMHAPPLVIYGAMRRWSAQHFRATLQGYFLPASILVMGGYWLTGLWVPAVTRNYLISLPVLLPAALLGRAINHRLHGGSFLKLVYLVLGVIGALLLAQAIDR